MDKQSAIIVPVDDGTFVVFHNGAPTEAGITHERALSLRSAILYTEWELLD